MYQLNNENFNFVEFHVIKIEEVPYNRFTMTPKRWKDKFNSIGIYSNDGKYGFGIFDYFLLQNQVNDKVYTKDVIKRD